MHCFHVRLRCGAWTLWARWIKAMQCNSYTDAMEHSIRFIAFEIIRTKRAFLAYRMNHEQRSPHRRVRLVSWYIHDYSHNSLWLHALIISNEIIKPNVNDNCLIAAEYQVDELRQQQNEKSKTKTNTKPNNKRSDLPMSKDFYDRVECVRFWDKLRRLCCMQRSKASLWRYFSFRPFTTFLLLISSHYRHSFCLSLSRSALLLHTRSSTRPHSDCMNNSQNRFPPILAFVETIKCIFRCLP